MTTMKPPIHHVLGELSSYLSGKMSFIERKRVESHLQTCEDCRRHCEELSRLRKMVYPRPANWQEYIPFKTIGIALALVAGVFLFGKVRKSFNLPKTPDTAKPAPAVAAVPTPAKVEEKPVELVKPQVVIPPGLPIPPTTLPVPVVRTPPQAPVVSTRATTSSPVPPLSTLPQWQGGASGILFARTVVVQSPAEWNKLWQEHQAGRPAPAVLPAVDFNQVTVVGVFTGARPTGGNAVEIYDLQTLPDQIVVRFRDIPAFPAPEAAITTLQPYHLKAIPKTTLPVRFDRQPNRP